MKPLVILSLLMNFLMPAQWLAAQDENPVEALLGTNRESAKALFEGEVAAEVLDALATFFDDHDQGRSEDEIDTYNEAYALAAYLYLYHNDRLVRSFGEEELKSFRQGHIISDWVKQEMQQALGYEDTGVALVSNGEKYAEAWREHLERNKQNILAADEQFLGPSRRKDPDKRLVAMVLGAGSCMDIPLQALVERYDEVVLVDLDEASMRDAVKKVEPKELRDKITLDKRDLTGGNVLGQARMITNLVGNGTRAEEARRRVGFFMNVGTKWVPPLQGLHRVDFMISSMLVTQLPIGLVRYYDNLLADKFGTDVESSSVESDQAIAEYVFRLHEAHTEALRDYAARSGGVVYYASDISGKPVVQTPDGLQGDLVEPFEGGLLEFDDLTRLLGSLRPLASAFSSRRLSSANYDFWFWDSIPAAAQEQVKTGRPIVITDEHGTRRIVPQGTPVRIGRRFNVNAIAFQYAAIQDD